MPRLHSCLHCLNNKWKDVPTFFSSILLRLQRGRPTSSSLLENIENILALYNSENEQTSCLWEKRIWKNITPRPKKKLKIFDKSLAKCVIHMQKGDSLYIYARSWYNLSTLAIILTISDLNSSKCCTISTLDLMFSTSWARFLSFANWETLFIFLDTSALCGLYCKAVWKALRAYNIRTEKT